MMNTKKVIETLENIWINDKAVGMLELGKKLDLDGEKDKSYRIGECTNIEFVLTNVYGYTEKDFDELWKKAHELKELFEEVA